MAGWHHRLNGHEFEQTPGDGEGQGSLACRSLWGCKESDTTEQLNNHLLIQNKSPEYHFSRLCWVLVAVRGSVVAACKVPLLWLSCSGACGILAP